MLEELLFVFIYRGEIPVKQINHLLFARSKVKPFKLLLLFSLLVAVEGDCH